MKDSMEQQLWLAPWHFLISVLNRKGGHMDAEHASREKNIHCKLFNFRAQKCLLNEISRDQNPPMRGF